MTADRRLLNAAILSTLCALTMATSARADALTDYRTAVMADAPLAAPAATPERSRAT